jgi:hypothetical protein
LVTLGLAGAFDAVRLLPTLLGVEPLLGTPPPIFGALAPGRAVVAGRVPALATLVPPPLPSVSRL